MNLPAVSDGCASYRTSSDTAHSASIQPWCRKRDLHRHGVRMCALIPALRAGRIDPIAALRQD
jgi:hypothetical protein